MGRVCVYSVHVCALVCIHPGYRTAVQAIGIETTANQGAEVSVWDLAVPKLILQVSLHFFCLFNLDL